MRLVQMLTSLQAWATQVGQVAIGSGWEALHYDGSVALAGGRGTARDAHPPAPAASPHSSTVTVVRERRAPDPATARDPGTAGC